MSRRAKGSVRGGVGALMKELNTAQSLFNTARAAPFPRISESFNPIFLFPTCCGGGELPSSTAWRTLFLLIACVLLFSLFLPAR